MYTGTFRVGFPALLIFMAAAGEPSDHPPAAASVRPTLQVGPARYRSAYNGVEFAFRFSNPGDEPLYLDCQGLPSAALEGKTLVLTFGRASDSAARPQRVGAHQTFEGYRRVDKIEGAAPDAAPGFSLLKVDMAVYPERSDGEGTPFVAERAGMVGAKAVTVAGKPRAASARPAGKTKRAP